MSQAFTSLALFTKKTANDTFPSCFCRAPPYCSKKPSGQCAVSQQVLVTDIIVHKLFHHESVFAATDSMFSAFSLLSTLLSSPMVTIPNILQR